MSSTSFNPKDLVKTSCPICLDNFSETTPQKDLEMGSTTNKVYHLGEVALSSKSIAETLPEDYTKPLDSVPDRFYHGPCLAAHLEVRGPTAHNPTTGASLVGTKFYEMENGTPRFVGAYLPVAYEPQQQVAQEDRYFRVKFLCGCLCVLGVIAAGISLGSWLHNHHPM
jgi:hypothetical protein